MGSSDIVCNVIGMVFLSLEETQGLIQQVNFAREIPNKVCKLHFSSQILHITDTLNDYSFKV